MFIAIITHTHPDKSVCKFENYFFLISQAKHMFIRWILSCLSVSMNTILLFFPDRFGRRLASMLCYSTVGIATLIVGIVQYIGMYSRVIGSRLYCSVY